MITHEDFDNICATCAFYMQHGFMDCMYIYVSKDLVIMPIGSIWFIWRHM